MKFASLVVSRRSSRRRRRRSLNGSRSRSRSKTSLRASTRAPTTRTARESTRSSFPPMPTTPRVRGEVVRPVLLRPLERRRAGRRRHVRRSAVSPRPSTSTLSWAACRRLGRRRPPVGGARGQQRQGAAPRGRRAERGGARRLRRAGRVGGAPVVRRHDDAVRHAGRVRQHRVDRRRLVLLAVHAGRVRLHVAAEAARRRRDGQRRAHDAPAGGTSASGPTAGSSTISLAVHKARERPHAHRDASIDGTSTRPTRDAFEAGFAGAGYDFTLLDLTPTRVHLLARR